MERQRLLPVVTAIAALGLAVFSLPSSARATLCPVAIYVEPTGDCCGESPCFSSLQDAFDLADDGDCILVAEGLYEGAELAAPAGAHVRVEGGWDSCFSNEGEQTVAVADSAITGRTAVSNLTITSGTLQIGGTKPDPCTTVEITATLTYGSNTVTGVTAQIGYPGSVSLPGTGGDASVLARVENLTGASGIFSAGDNDGDPTDLFVNVGLVSIPGPIPSGPFAKVELDCEDGVAPSVDEFQCATDAADGDGLPVAASCSLSLKAIP